ncbi:MAG: MBL fold metallo-hydrolase [Ginsengibacter sp.]
MNLTCYGNVCFSVELNNKLLFFAPFILPNTLAKDIDIDKIKGDYILISHTHGDHIADVEQIAKAPGAALISSLEVCDWFQKRELPLKQDRQLMPANADIYLATLPIGDNSAAGYE